MNKLLRQLISRLNDHLSDDRMAALICHELSFGESVIAKRHLAKCWHCRVRKEDLEGRRADQMMSLYREAIDRQELSLKAAPRAQFLARLNTRTEPVASRMWWYLRLPQITGRPIAAVAACIVLGAGMLASFFYWQQLHPDMSSNALLASAERWDTPSFAASDGVVFQLVRITASHRTMERTIYRDVQGKRRLKQIKLNAGDAQLQSRLTQAGLDWEKPISASSYREWHDRQHVRGDKIVRGGRHLLTLTTTVLDGSISQESLTVRDTDFHPVRRTIAFRDGGPVEIAELDFKILPWSGVDADIFESIGSEKAVSSAVSASALSVLRMPEILSEKQLDEAELNTRLILNQLHADTGEQIEIDRTPQKIEVKGLVETDERKRALQAQLGAVPHLLVAIQSVADLKKNPGSEDAIGNMQTASMPDQPSPLEIYLLPDGRSVNAISVLAHRLFESALAISQESKAIHDLQTRFDPEKQKSAMASATLADLIYSHRERLQSALKQERGLLAEAQGTPAIAGRVSGERLSLAEASAKNLALCKELTQTNGSATRSADKILAGMSVSVDALTRDVYEAYSESDRGDSPLNGNK